MLRFVVIFLFCVGLAPFLPRLIEHQFGSEAIEKPETRTERNDRPVSRTHRISRDRSGHYRTDAQLNGRTVEMMVDTGASLIALPESVAEDIGIFLNPSDYKHPFRTANGVAYAAVTTIDSLRIGNIKLRDVEASVVKDQSLGFALLGMSALNRLKRFDFSEGSLVLVQ